MPRKDYTCIMNENKKKAKDAQGAEIEEKKEQKASVSYAIKAIGTHAKTLKDAGYMDEDSYNAFEEWRTKTGGEFMRKQLGL